MTPKEAWIYARNKYDSKTWSFLQVCDYMRDYKLNNIKQDKDDLPYNKDDMFDGLEI